MSRQRDFLRFCSKALGTGENTPLRDINGATIGALVDAFRECNPIAKPTPSALSMQSFDEPMWSERWTVYTIRNQVSGAVYVGVAKEGFRARYSACEWWKDHHNERLMRDVLAYGLMNFRVLLYVCIDARDMKRQEAELLRANRLITYNVRPESDNV